MRRAAVLGETGRPGAKGCAMRFREDKPGDLEKARAEVTAWREQHPDGTAEEMLADLAGRFHPDYGPVLRSVLFRTDLRSAKITTGITSITGENR